MKLPRRAQLVLIAVAFLFVGGICASIGASIVWQDYRYRSSGTRATAVAIGKTLQRATEGSDTAYEISYRVQLAGGRSVDRTERVPVHTWERIERNAPIEVEILPDANESTRVVRDTSGDVTQALLFLGIGIVVLAIGVSVAIAAIRGRARVDRVPSEPAIPVAPPLHRSFWQVARGSPRFWIGAVFALIALPFALVGAVLSYNAVRFSRGAVSTTGMVLTKETSTHRSGERKSTRYEVSYRFAANGRTFEGRDDVSRGEWNQMIEREPVGVRYLPDNPATNHLAVHSGWMLPAIFTAVGSIVLAVGVALLAGAAKKIRLAMRLERHGVTVPGTVVELVPRNIEINGEWLVSLRFEYADALGVRRTSASDMSLGDAERWKIGDTGRVAYDPSHPDEAMWLGRP
ncbi:MAG TPA: DUF3592 domain-containing protein [Vicinamibacterales bacterium]